MNSSHNYSSRECPVASMVAYKLSCMKIIIPHSSCNLLSVTSVYIKCLVLKQRNYLIQDLTCVTVWAVTPNVKRKISIHVVSLRNDMLCLLGGVALGSCKCVPYFFLSWPSPVFFLLLNFSCLGLQDPPGKSSCP